MDIAGYISTGVLELYATGQLTGAEKAEVESLVRQHPEIRAELSAITASLDQYAALHAVSPPAALKGKILSYVQANGPKKPFRSEPAGPGPDAPMIPLVAVEQRAASDAFKWLVIVSVVLLLVSNGLSIFFYRHWKTAEERLELALASQQQYAKNIQGIQQQLSQKEMALALLGDPGTKMVELKGVAKYPDSRVTVYWHQPSKNVYLTVNNLPAPPAGRQYQLWALVNGKPVDAGVLHTMDALASLQQMKDIGQAQAFAITLEPKGGSASPTLDQMYVMGNI